MVSNRCHRVNATIWCMIVPADQPELPLRAVTIDKHRKNLNFHQESRDPCLVFECLCNIIRLSVNLFLYYTPRSLKEPHNSKFEVRVYCSFSDVEISE